MHHSGVKLSHLALNVSDPAASSRFYLDTIGLAGTAVREEWGQRLRLEDGFMLALIEGAPLPSDVADRVHFGCHLPDEAAVRAARARLRAGGTEEVEWSEEPGYVSVKVRDPDGYVVEVSYDIQ